MRSVVIWVKKNSKLSKVCVKDVKKYRVVSFVSLQYWLTEYTASGNCPLLPGKYYSGLCWFFCDRQYHEHFLWKIQRHWWSECIIFVLWTQMFNSVIWDVWLTMHKVRLTMHKVRFVWILCPCVCVCVCVSFEVWGIHNLMNFSSQQPTGRYLYEVTSEK